MSYLSVNLTTTASRQDICVHAVLSLLNQSLQPDVIRLWISKEPYLRDSGFKEAPKWVDTLNGIKDIIEVFWVDNTGPYRKLIPALRAARADELIVTADDDIVYGKEWLKELIDMARSFPGELVAARVRFQARNFLGIKKSYIAWPIVSAEKILESDYLVTHGGGAVFSKDMIRDDLLASDDYLKVCPTADDLWYSRIVLESGVPVRVCTKALSELYFIEHGDGLDNYNLLKSRTLISKMYNKVVLKAWGQIGFSVCGNDYSSRKIDNYFLEK